MASATGAVDVDSDLLVAVGLSLLWFVLGYAFFACACAFACVGSLVPRLEELQASTTPLTLIVMISLLVAFAVNSDPEGTLATSAPSSRSPRR